jgi:hypothetical protein
MIENEEKIVLRYSLDLEDTLSNKYGWHDIKQGYLNSNIRIREIIHQSGRINHVFSFKQRIEETGRNIEIESEEITKADFDALWKTTSSRLLKRRVSCFVTVDDPINIEGGRSEVRWDIDFPRWESGEKYFVLAEVEMPHYMEKPPFILDDIVSHVVFEVPRSDNRFSAKKLSDENCARKLAKELGLILN